MKRVWPIFVIFLCFAASAHAEKLIIGSTIITHDVPVGYVKANEKPYSELRSLLSQAMPADLRILELYVENPVDGAHDMIVLYSIMPLHESIFGLSEFAALKKETVENIPSVLLDFAEKNPYGAHFDAMAGAMGGKKFNMMPRSVEFLDTTDTSFSSLMHSDLGLVRADGQEDGRRIVAFNTCLLAEGKVVCLVQFRPVDPAENLQEHSDAFKEHARRVVREFGFREGPSKK